MDFVATWEFPSPDLKSDPPRITLQTWVTPQAGDVDLRIGGVGPQAWVTWGQHGLRVARDAMGRYPMVWFADATRLMVASDPTLLPKSPIRWERWARWLEGIDDPDPEDFFEGVNRILPGQELHWADPTRPPHVHTPAFLSAEEVDPQALADEVQAALNHTCTPLSRPVLFLSDGLDSSLIATYLAQHGHTRATTMVTRFHDVTRLDLVHATAKVCGMKVSSNSIDGWTPFHNAHPWLETPQYGPLLYPGLAYELPFARQAVEHHNADCIVSGVGADQLFDRSAFQLYHWGIEHRDWPAVDAATDYFFLKELVSMELGHLGVYRRLRLPAPTKWSERGAFLRHPSYRLHTPFILDSWEWEGAVRSLRATEKAVGVPIVLPLANESIFQAVRRFSHATHFSVTSKPVLRLLAEGRLPRKVVDAPKSTSFTAIFDDALAKLSVPEVRGVLQALDPIVDADSAANSFPVRDSTVRRARYLLAGEVASDCGFR